MAFTTPVTWQSQLVTVAQFNEQIRDNMNALKEPPRGLSYVSARDYSLDTSGAWSLVDTGDVNGHFRHTITVTDDSTVTVQFIGQVRHINNNGRVGFGVSVDGTQYFPASGIAFNAAGGLAGASALIFPVSFSVKLTGQVAGSHTYRLTWFGTNTATTLHATAGHIAQFAVTEQW